MQISDYKNKLYNLQSRKSKAVSFVIEYNGDIDKDLQSDDFMGLDLEFEIAKFASTPTTEKETVVLNF